jgi:hypothetical protein
MNNNNKKSIFKIFKPFTNKKSLPIEEELSINNSLSRGQSF